MRHRIQREPRISASEIDPGGSEAMRRQSFPYKKDNTEGSLNYPMLKIQNAQTGEGKEADQRKQLVAPFHERDLNVATLGLPATAGTRLWQRGSPATFANYGGSGHAPHSRRMGNQSGRIGKASRE